MRIFIIKKSIKLNAMDAPMVSYINNSVYIPTSLDDKLFYIDNNFKVSEEKVDDGASFVRTKKKWTTYIIQSSKK